MWLGYFSDKELVSTYIESSSSGEQRSQTGSTCVRLISTLILPATVPDGLGDDGVAVSAIAILIAPPGCHSNFARPSLAVRVSIQLDLATLRGLAGKDRPHPVRQAVALSP